MDQDARVRQGKAFLRRSRGQQRRRHAGRLSDADGGHVRPDELHGVVNRHAGGNRAAGRVDVKRDVFFRVFGLQEQHLRDDQVGDIVIDRSAKKNDVVPQQPGINIVGPLAPAGLLNHHGHKHCLLLLVYAGISALSPQLSPPADDEHRSATPSWKSNSGSCGSVKRASGRSAIKRIQGLLVANAMPNSIQPAILGQTSANLFHRLLRLRGQGFHSCSNSSSLTSIFSSSAIWSRISAAFTSRKAASR